MDNIVNDFRGLNTRYPSSYNHNAEQASAAVPPPSDGTPVYRETRTATHERRPSTPGRTSKKPVQNFSRRPSLPKSPAASYSLYPALSNPPISKPLPPLPTSSGGIRRAPSKSSSSVDTLERVSSRHSQSSKATTDIDRESDAASVTASPYIAPPLKVPAGASGQIKEATDQGASAVTLQLVPWKLLEYKDKSKDSGVYYVDTSFTSNILASKHGSSAITFWSLATGQILQTLKISSYTRAGSRGREYLIRSHAVLSESFSLAAIAARLGNTLEIWNWAKDKHIQTINHANRWAAKRSDHFAAAWPPLAVYSGEAHPKTIDLYTAEREKKKPFSKAYSIDLEAAGLPFIPQFPELAFSATSPLLVAASGPRPPRVGSPPPARATLLVVWELPSNGSSVTSSTPYKMIKPWKHSELDTALPCSLVAYGSVVVSIWIPAGIRAVPVPASRGGKGYNLMPVPVPQRYVLVWDFSADSTRAFSIPNTTAAVSPDCRFVAYCDTAGTEHGARGKLVILDALTGRQMWCWPDPDAGEADSAHNMGFRQLEDLGGVTELAFSDDGGLLFVGDREGAVCVYDIRELGGKGLQVHVE